MEEEITEDVRHRLNDGKLKELGVSKMDHRELVFLDTENEVSGGNS